MNQPELLNAMLRQDFYLFVQRVFREIASGEEFLPNWHVEAICNVLVEIGEKRQRRQIVEVPPRSLKSICSSVALVAWLLGRDPTRKIICVSYSQELANRFSRQTRQVMKSRWYRDVFPGTVISSEKDTERDFFTTAGGYRNATSVGGTLTGIGADLIIIDDPAKPGEMMSEVQRNSVNEWFDGTLYTRLNNKERDGILIVMQRLHYEDLVGHVRQHDDWGVLTLPAIAREDQRVPLGYGRWHERREGEVIDPRRESRATLDAIKAALGSAVFSAQYQQEPLPEDGSIIDWRWFRTYDQPPPRDKMRIVQSWDCASKNTEFSDYSVCLTFGIVGLDYYLLDVVRRRLLFPELVALSRQLGEQWRPHEILIEDAAAGTQLIQYLRFDRPIHMPTPMHVKPHADKVTRLHAVSAVVEQGRVYLPLSAPWLDELRLEVLQFPYGKHDDQIDALSQFLARQEHRHLRGPAVQIVPMFGSREFRRRHTVTG